MFKRIVAALDIETTGLDQYGDKITVIGVYTPTKSKIYRNDFEELISDIKEGWLQGMPLVGHNFTFDLGFLIEHTSLELALALSNWYADTCSMAHISTENVTDKYLEWYEKERIKKNKELPTGFSHRKAGPLSLKTLAPFHLGVDPFWEDPTNHDDDTYVLKDCKYTYDLYQFFADSIEGSDADSFYLNKIMSWDKMLFNATQRGIEISPDIIDSSIEEYAKRSDELLEELSEMWKAPIAHYREALSRDIKNSYKEKTIAAVNKLKDKTKAEGTRARYKKLMANALQKADLSLNFDSSTQLAWLLRDYYNLDITDMEGKESTGKAVLERLAQEGREDVKLLLKYRKSRKIQTSFLPSYKELSHENIIHPRFNITGTRTGRLSCSSPNFQQQPSSMYKMFKPRDGYTFLQYDYGSIEAVLIALYSEDSILNTIVSKGGSLHNYNAVALFNLGCKPEEVPEKYPKERKVAKTIGFSILYGAGKNRVQHAFATAGIILSDAEASKKVKQIRKMFKDAKDFHREITEIFEAGEVVKNLLGRPIYIPNSGDAYMKGFNTLIQSSASDLLLDASYKATQVFKEEGLDATPVAFIHDFVMVEVKKEHAERANKILVDCLLNYPLENKFGELKLSVDGHIDTVWRK